ncbi:unnamed protein product [Chondrus crispus]|uniref:Uncharacterized protein n=1 Tax=Chondrus crispus TaxID=2769 RepID=R7QF58_CHOCR|nr:unnamed protein product [Chondrus crispus]CDF36071.1 unnamed protein product [Chondrus crispus]|eukprot:XP_005715890.1 unnamed protein product [Chondrus crispus]
MLLSYVYHSIQQEKFEARRITAGSLWDYFTVSRCVRVVIHSILVVGRVNKLSCFEEEKIAQVAREVLDQN